MSSLIKFALCFFIFIFNNNAPGQVFIPHSYWQNIGSCRSDYCPTPTVVAGTLQGTAGMTQIVNIGTCAGSGAGDDQFTAITLPFNFTISSLGTYNWFVGSNTYLTADAGATNYSGLGGGVPARKKFFLGAADNSYKAVYIKSGTNYFRIRYEGYASTNCTGTQIVYEFTFYRPTMTNQYAVVVFGTHGRTAGQFGVANATTYLLNNTGALSANQSYLFTSNNGGTTWTSQAGWSITGTGTTL